MNNVYASIIVASLIWGVTATPAWSEPDCDPVDDYGYVCGLQNPEDLVQVPDSQWIIASGMAPGAPLALIDTGAKSWKPLYPGDQPVSRPDNKRYPDCPGPPETSQWITHGLNLQPGKKGHATLYVVMHGSRETIEVFDLVTGGDEPRLVWTGCVLMPDGMPANSVASLPDGTLLATIPLRTGFTINDALSNNPTGGVYRWSPGDSGFRFVEGTDMPYANGIEVSPDGSEFYVASSGMVNVTAWSNTNPAQKLRTSAPLSFIPDNLHRGPDGSLLTAGLNIEDATCGNIEMGQPFDFEAFVSCPRPFVAWSVDPQTLEGHALATGPANPKFSNVTMVLPVGEELWIGTFGGDRVAYRVAP